MRDPASVEPQIPEAFALADSAFEIHLWAQPQTADLVNDYDAASNPFRQLQNISFDVVASDAGIVLRHGLIHNPDADPFSAGGQRFTNVVDSDHPFTIVDQGGQEIVFPRQTAAGIERLSGFSVSLPSVDTGIGPSCATGSGVCVPGLSGPSWLLGTFEIDAVEIGDFEVHLQIGSQAITHVGEQTPETQVILGVEDGIVYDAFANRQDTLVGDSIDALIRVVDRLPGDFTEDGFSNGKDFLEWQRGGSPMPLSTSDLAEWKTNFGLAVATLSSLPGDFNDDGHVDGADFLHWQRGGSPEPLSAADLIDWRENFASSAAFTAVTIAVPEPSTLWLGIAGAIFASAAPRRAQRNCQYLMNVRSVLALVVRWVVFVVRRSARCAYCFQSSESSMKIINSKFASDLVFCAVTTTILFSCNASKAAPVSTQVVVVTGDSAPDGNGSFLNASFVVLNDSGQVSFLGDLQGTIAGPSDDSGVFRNDGATLTQIARAGETPPGGNGAFDFFGAPALNSTGQVAFTGILTGTSGGSSDDRGIYRYDNGTLNQIIREGEASPDGNGTFSSLGNYSLNGAGQLAIAAFLSGSSGGVSQNRGIYFADGGGLTQVIRRGETVPNINGVYSGFDRPVLNESGNFAFESQLSGTSGGTTDNEAIYVSDNGAILEIVREGQIAPDGNGNFGQLSSPTFSDAGQALFAAEMTDAAPFTNTGLYRSDGGGLTQVARRGHAAPGGSGDFGSFDGYAINSNGQVVFSNTLTGSGVVFRPSLFKYDGGSLARIIADGDSAPDGNGVFDSFDDEVVNDAGRIAFTGFLDGTSGGLSDDEGLYLFDDGVGLVQVARTGDALLGSTITDLSFQVGSVTGSEANGFNDLDQLAYHFTLADGREGVAITTVDTTISASWLNATDGNWNDAANWDSDNFPDNAANTYDASIAATGAAYAVTLDSAVTVDRLVLDSADATVSHTSGTFSVVETAELLAGTFQQAGGVLAGGTYLQNGGEVIFTSGSRLDGVTLVGNLNAAEMVGFLRLQNGTTFSGDANISGACDFGGGPCGFGIVSVEHDLTLQEQTITLGSDGIIGVFGATTLTFGPQTTVDLNGSSARIRSDLGSSLSADSVLNGRILNQGTIIASGGQGLRVISPDIFDNQGTVRVTSGTTLTLTSNSTWINSGIYQVDVGSTLSISGVFAHRGAGTIAGAGRVQISNLINEAAVRPGNSPGILTIDGDYTQLSDGSLEIEIAGLTPGSEHDQLDVTGAAMLGGRLDVPLIDSFTPAVGDEVVFLTAASVTGAFENYNFPNELPDGVAQQLAYSATDVRVQFFAPVPIEFVSNDADAEWTTPSDWQENGMDATPDSLNILSVSNNRVSGESQTVNLVAPVSPTQINAAHSLTVGDATDKITLSINDTSLSSTTTTTITANGAIEQSGDSVLSARMLDVQGGGRFAGTGIVIGDVEVGTSGPGEAIIEPGIEAVGELSVVGDLTQGGGGVFAIDIAGDNSGDNHDTVIVTGDVVVDGAIKIDVSDLTDQEFTPGDTYKIVETLASATGDFDQIEVIGRDDIYFDISVGTLELGGGSLAALGAESTEVVQATGYYRGDGDQDGDVDDVDAQVFAAMLVDNSLGSFDCGGECFAAANFLDAFDFFDPDTEDGLRTVDFYDIPRFAEALAGNAGSLSAAYTMIDQALIAASSRVSIPEPKGIVLFMISGFLAMVLLPQREMEGRKS